MTDGINRNSLEIIVTMQGRVHMQNTSLIDPKATFLLVRNNVRYLVESRRISSPTISPRYIDSIQSKSDKPLRISTTTHSMNVYCCISTISLSAIWYCRVRMPILFGVQSKVTRCRRPNRVVLANRLSRVQPLGARRIENNSDHSRNSSVTAALE